MNYNQRKDTTLIYTDDEQTPASEPATEGEAPTTEAEAPAQEGEG